MTTSLLDYSLAALAEAYDDRAAIEAELKADKGGLQLHRRRKQRLAAEDQVPPEWQHYIEINAGYFRSARA